MAENMISGEATRPGDVLTMYGGKTVEVLNTDAEGRLVLADALVKATEAKPDVIVDVATLTGACVMALGDRVAGLMGNDDDFVAQVRGAGDRAGEPLWPLPIPDEMGEKVRGNSKIADLAQHNTDRWGGALYAAAFLREFVGDATAGRTWTSPGRRSTTRLPTATRLPGGTGVAVATLVELADRSCQAPEPPLVLLPLVLLPHPRRVADHGGVVRRDAVAVGEAVRPVDRRHPAPGPLTVVGDQHHRDVA